MNIPSNILTMLAGIALTLISLWYGHHHGLMPVQASNDAVQIDGLFDSMMTVGTGIFLLVWGTLIISLIKFRRRAGDEGDGQPIEGNVLLEIVWTAIPVVIVLVISVYSFDVYNSMGGFDPEAAQDPGIIPSRTEVAMLPGEEAAMPLMASETTQPQAPKHHHHHMALGIGASAEEAKHEPYVSIDVTGLQYAWIFKYPTGVTTGELHLPVNQDARLRMKAQDVIHAFWLPEFRLKQDVLPSQDAELRFTPTRIGDYPVICAELCGPYHGGMVTRLYVQSQTDYDNWLQQQTVAMQATGDRTIATNPLPVNPLEQSDQNFLAPHAEHLGIDAVAVKQLHDSQRSDSQLFDRPLDRPRSDHPLHDPALSMAPAS